MNKWFTVFYYYIPKQFVYPTASDTHLHFFHILILTYRAAITILGQVFVQTCVFIPPG